MWKWSTNVAACIAAGGAVLIGLMMPAPLSAQNRVIPGYKGPGFDAPQPGENPSANGSAYGGQRLTLETAPITEDLALSCVFETECFEGEACMSSGYSMALTGRAGGLVPTDLAVEVTLSGDAEDVRMLGVASSGAFALSGGGFDARHLLTISDTGSARYTVHYAQGPMVISYLGRCE